MSRFTSSLDLGKRSAGPKWVPLLQKEGREGPISRALERSQYSGSSAFRANPPAELEPKWA